MTYFIKPNREPDAILEYVDIVNKINFQLWFDKEEPLYLNYTYYYFDYYASNSGTIGKFCLVNDNEVYFKHTFSDIDWKPLSPQFNALGTKLLPVLREIIAEQILLDNNNEI